MDWSYIKWKIFVYPRLELIYLLGGIPKEHIGTLNYRNLDSVVRGLKKQIKAAND